MFDTGMNNEQFNSHLETLAKLIEASATSVEEAAQIVRDAKIPEVSRTCADGFELLGGQLGIAGSAR